VLQAPLRAGQPAAIVRETREQDQMLIADQRQHLGSYSADHRSARRPAARQRKDTTMNALPFEQAASSNLRTAAATLMDVALASLPLTRS
jgi:hypothetical protein